ncbi:hypothetical protein WG66_013615 [Moniliophthora roreri]|nr:hypothetical protein WG66_013615 [Moniliophthora roreri]
MNLEALMRMGLLYMFYHTPARLGRHILSEPSSPEAFTIPEVTMEKLAELDSQYAPFCLPMSDSRKTGHSKPGTCCTEHDARAAPSAGETRVSNAS